jgi:hypothetical protein
MAVTYNGEVLDSISAQKVVYWTSLDLRSAVIGKPS